MNIYMLIPNAFMSLKATACVEKLKLNPFKSPNYEIRA